MATSDPDLNKGWESLGDPEKSAALKYVKARRNQVAPAHQKDDKMDEDGSGNQEEPRPLGKCIKATFYTYVVAASLLSVAYACWMFYERYHVQKEFGEATKWVYLEFLPCWWHLFSRLIDVLSTVRTYKQAEPGSLARSTKVAQTLGEFLNHGSIYMVGAQVVVLLFRTVKQYLAVIPSAAACFCLLAAEVADPHLYSGLVHSCECLVPGQEDNIFVMTSDPHTLDSDILSDYGSDYEGPVEVWTVLNATTKADVPWLQSRPHLTMMLLVLHMSVIVAAIRFPITAVIVYFIQFKVTDDGVLEGEDVAFWDLPKDFQVREVTSRTIMMSLNIIAAGLDAFSLVDEMINSPSLYVNNVHLTNSVLVFAMFTINLAYSTGAANKLSEDMFQYSSLLYTNLPLLILRSYILVMDDDLDNLDGSSGRKSAFFALFIIKEVIVIILMVVELAINAYDACKSESKNSFGQTMLNVLKDKTGCPGMFSVFARMSGQTWRCCCCFCCILCGYDCECCCSCLPDEMDAHGLDSDF